MSNVIRTRTRMGVVRGWERFVLRRGSVVASGVVIAAATAALISYFPVHIG